MPHLRVAGPRFVTRAQLRRSWYIGLFQLRGVAERALAADDFALIDRLWRDWSPGFAAPVDELAEVKASAIAARASRAVLGYYRAVSSRRAHGECAACCDRTRVPSLYVHGVDDGCMGVELGDGVERAYAAGVDVSPPRRRRSLRASGKARRVQPRAPRSTS